MRRGKAWAGVVLTMLVTALCVPGAIASPPGDAVTGEALLPGPFLVQADAHSGPTGESPSGRIALIASCCTRKPDIGGSVTCLAVDGNRAVVGLALEVTDPLTGRPVPFARRIEVVDGGSPGVGVDVVTLFAGQVGPPVTDCRAPLPPGGQVLTVRPPLGPGDPPAVFFPDRPLGQDVVVTDAPPGPTSKKDCQKGGYRSFGFATKRACLAHVKRPTPP